MPLVVRRCPRGVHGVYPRVGGGTNRRFTPRFHSMIGVYPRVGGGTEDAAGGAPLSQGRSRGSIPAWAGEPVSAHAYRTVALFMIGVYPRVGGGTSESQRQQTPGEGLSPRGRGNPRSSGVQVRAGRTGVYPRVGRGNRRSGGKRFWGLIGVYPRVGGGTRKA